MKPEQCRARGGLKCSQGALSNAAPCIGELLQAQIHCLSVERDWGCAYQELFQQISRLAEQVGFDYVRYERRRPFPLTQTKLWTLDNFPSDLRRTLTEAICASESGGARSEPPLDRSGVSLHAADFAGLGLHGTTFTMTENAGVYALFTVIRTIEAKLGFDVDTKILTSFAVLSHVLLSSTLNRAQSSLRCALTSREIEVLRWTGDGLTASDIAELLSISVNTVNFHLKTVREKLCSRSKTSAVVQAALLGLLR